MNKPNWYTADHDKGWDRVKTAFANDWEQTKHDFGSKSARDLDQNANDTVKQATGTEDAFTRHEPAFRFGYAANRNYRSQYPKWSNDLEDRLRKDYGSDYERDKNDIRRAYEFRYDSAGDKTTENREGSAERF